MRARGPQGGAVAGRHTRRDVLSQARDRRG
jgi:hypothetical protein